VTATKPNRRQFQKAPRRDVACYVSAESMSEPGIVRS
jgi:hypothetical protein